MLTILQLMQKDQNNYLSKQGMKTEKTDTNYYS